MAKPHRVQWVIIFFFISILLVSQRMYINDLINTNENKDLIILSLEKKCLEIDERKYK